MKITVILCTYNRSASLRKALTSVARSILPETMEWQVLVVDNNSKDNTREVVSEFARVYPERFAYLFEPRPGKSFALNAGIQASTSDILAFMDDDVEVDSQWLHNLTAKFLEGNWSGTGGRILPEKGFVPPQWLETQDRYALAPLAVFDRGPEAGELDEPPFGTNMAYRTEMFVKYGGFRTDLGPRPGSELRNEDSDFGSRLLAAGERFWYEPAAIVYHEVTAKRLRKDYFVRWWYDKARGDIRQDGIPTDAGFYVAGIPFYFIRRSISWGLRWLFTLDPGERFSRKLSVCRNYGMMIECYRIASSLKKRSKVSTQK
jgi:glycosyltransferase involved in cell wall biosynthesis